VIPHAINVAAMTDRRKMFMLRSSTL